MQMFKKILASILVLAMTLSFVSCANTDYAMEIDSVQIPAGLYIIYQNLAISEVQSHPDYDVELTVFWDNMIEGKSMEQWINDRAIELAKQVIATNEIYDELGLSLTEEDIAEIEFSMADWDANAESYESIGVGETSFEKQIENGVKATDAFIAYYDAENGIEPISDDDLITYFEDDFTLYKFIDFSKLDSATGEALADDALEDVEDRIDEYLKKAEENPQDFDEIFEEKVTEDAEIAGSEAPTFEEDANYMQIAKEGEGDSFDSYYISAEVETAIFEDAKIGEPILIESDNTDYIVLRYDINDYPENFDLMRESLLFDLKQDEFLDISLERAAEYEVVLNEAAINRYSPRNLVN